MNNHELMLNENSSPNINRNFKEYKTFITILKDFFHTKNITTIHLLDAKNEQSLRKIKWDSEFLDMLKKDTALQYNEIDKKITFLNKKIISNVNQFIEILRNNENGIIYEKFYDSFNEDLVKLLKEGIVKVITFEGSDKKILFYRNLEDDIEKLLINNKEMIDLVRKIWKNSKITDSIS